MWYGESRFRCLIHLPKKSRQLSIRDRAPSCFSNPGPNEFVTHNEGNPRLKGDTIMLWGRRLGVMGSGLPLIGWGDGIGMG